MKIIVRLMCLTIIFVFCFNTLVFSNNEIKTTAKSVILIEQSSGEVLYENNADEKLPIASVTKVMTMLLTMEAIQSGKITMNDKVTASEHACSMGGSTIYLEPGEQMVLSDMLKGISVASGNDAAVAVAEHIMGSESAFVKAMNERAKDLGMNNTHFMNCNGLDEDDHYSSARDVAVMSRELLKHKEIIPYLTIWMDSLRNGKFGLSNTNKLIRFYDGAIGVKTGSTSKAKYCISSAAKRDGMTLIAVVLAAESTSDRFETAKALLNYGFANYSVSTPIKKDMEIGKVTVLKGIESECKIVAKNDYSKLIGKGTSDKIETLYDIPKEVKAPIAKNQKIGEIIIKLNGKEVGKVDAIAQSDINHINVLYSFNNLIKIWSCGNV